MTGVTVIFRSAMPPATATIGKGQQKKSAAPPGSYSMIFPTATGWKVADNMLSVET